MNDGAIALHNVRKRFGSVVAVDSVTFQVAHGEFFSLLGPSGCGKTTLLRLIAGFEEADEGELRIGEALMNRVPPQRRPVNTVFQNYALFPHLDVFENVAFGLRVRNVDGTELNRRVADSLDLLHIGDLRHRLPAELSGGQKQRVALARALVVEPKVLLLDEPLAAVDAQRRSQVQDDLRTLQRHSKTTFIYVTHDQQEALALSDRMAVMQSGRIAQIGKPNEVYERPKTRFVASFLGRCNWFPASVNGASEVRTEFGVLKTTETLNAKTEVTMGIRSERLILNAQTGGNIIRARVKGVSYVGPLTEYALQCQNTSFRALVPGGPRFQIDECVSVQFPAEALFLLQE